MRKMRKLRKNILLIAAVVLMILTAFYISYRYTSLDNNAESILNSHFKKYHDQEYFSGIALSVYQPGQEIKNYYIGKDAHDNTGKNIDANTLFEIGSITKSFTSAIILQLEKEKKLVLSDTLDKWLPEYSKWSTINIQALLNMTSGLPNYTDAPLLNAGMYLYPSRVYTNKDLINFVYPAGELSPPLKHGYEYTNTGYILASMIIEKITQHSLQTEIENRLIKTVPLTNTFYPVPDANKNISNRLARGYGFNPYTNPEQVGKDTSKVSLSWAAGAGAMISNSSDIIKWVRALFVEQTILDQTQKNHLMQMVSTTNGKPVTTVSNTERTAFALGVTQGYEKEIGKYWFYEGQTEGFRALYMYVPANGIIISSIFNSSVNTENDHAGELMKAVYQMTKQDVKTTSR